MAQLARDLTEMVSAVAGCRRCPLYRTATQAVCGAGPAPAGLMLVGEQPGDSEDKAGLPFVGPAGRVLDRALGEAGIARRDVYLTNGVKHFKNVPRGKRRIHQRPNAYEIDRCRWWLDQELALVRPRLAVALGATAARALSGRPLTIGSNRGRLLELRPGLDGLVTIHPSYILRLRDPSREEQYGLLVADLRRAAELARADSQQR